MQKARTIPTRLLSRAPDETSSEEERLRALDDYRHSLHRGSEEAPSQLMRERSSRTEAATSGGEMTDLI